MPIIRLLPGGSSGGFPGTGRKPDDGGKPRGEVKGWSKGASRRLVAFLWSIDPGELGEGGLAVTLTMGGTPDHARQWHAARKAFIKRAQRLGIIRYHWVIEWTAKKRPHLHMALYGPGYLHGKLLKAWLEICDTYDWPAEPYAQHITAITGASGWLEYLAKHASRGVGHYQRQGAPDGWEKTGRLWGFGGDWPVEEPWEHLVSDTVFWTYRRHVRRYQRARLRAVGAYRASRYVGKNHGDKERGKFAGVSGWIPVNVSYELLKLSSEGKLPFDTYEWDN